MAQLKYFDPVTQTYKPLHGVGSGPTGPTGPTGPVSTTPGPTGPTGPTGPVRADRAQVPSGLFFTAIPSSSQSTMSVGSPAMKITRLQLQQAVDQVQIEVTTAVAASNIRLGVWADDANLYPGALLHQSALVLSTTTGFKTFAVTLSPGFYWMGLTSDKAPAVRSISNGAWSNPLLPGFTAPVTGTGIVNPSNWYQSSGVPVGSLPDPFPMAGIVRSPDSAENVFPFLWFRAT